jgi:hypothetical protein
LASLTAATSSFGETPSQLRSWPKNVNFGSRNWHLFAFRVNPHSSKRLSTAVLNLGLGYILIFWFITIFSITIIVSKVETWAMIYRNYRHVRWLSWYCFTCVYWFYNILKNSFNS